MTARWWHRLIARATFTTRAVDRTYRLFDRARSQAVVRWASNPTLVELNSLAYQADDVYHPEAPTFRSRLFTWELAALRDHFDPAPGRVLIGGVGGGREAFALAQRGYEVVAFEPAPELAAAMARRAASMTNVQTYRGGYEDLPKLFAARDGDRSADLRTLGRFSAAIFGWSSFSHLLNRQARLTSLRMVGDVTDGPILVSFLSFGRPTGGVRPPGGNEGRDDFSVFIGYYHSTNEDEFRELAAEAGLSVVALNVDEIDSAWPHAILRRER